MRSAVAAGASWVLKITGMVGIAKISRMSAKTTVQETSRRVWPCTCFGMGAPGFSRKRKQTQRSPASTAMPMPSVHQEISMKMLWVIRPYPDFGRTVVMGVSHSDHPQEETSRTTASSRSAVGTRESRLLRMESFAYLGGSPGVRTGDTTADAVAGRWRSKTITQLRAQSASTMMTGIEVHRTSVRRRRRPGGAARRQRMT